jgi:hypothetical protein
MRDPVPEIKGFNCSIKILQTHLSDDKAVAKMGHPAN